jgi:thiol-disulfide isomerase/thioredoxin
MKNMKNKMKGLKYLLIVVGLMSTTNIIAQSMGEYILEGEISGLKTPTKLYLIEWPNPDTIARAITKNGKFIFRGKVKGANAYFIKMDAMIHKKPSEVMYLTNHKIKMRSSLATWPEVEIIGSEAHDDYLEVEKLYKDMPKPASEKDNSRLRLSYIDFLKRHPNSLYAPLLVSRLKQFIGEEVVIEAYNNFTPRVKESYFGLELKKEIRQLKLAEQIKIGATLPDFKLSTPDGHTMSVLEYAKKGKITLIDFWASWCKPCREETPNMKKVYDTFHDQGFNIIGVSTDKNEAAWKKALIEENTLWFQGRDNLEYASKGIFALGAIPAFALVDGEGKMIAFSCASSIIPSFGPEIRGEALYKTIEELLTKKSN